MTITCAKLFFGDRITIPENDFILFIFFRYFVRLLYFKFKFKTKKIQCLKEEKPLLHKKMFIRGKCRNIYNLKVI